jgi:perosamine synthetase
MSVDLAAPVSYDSLTPPVRELAPMAPVMDKHALGTSRDLPAPWNAARWISAARVGISIAFQDCGIDQGAAVWVPSYFATGMIRPVEWNKMTVRFYPVTESLDIDLAALKRQYKLDIRAIVAPHFFGFPQSSMADLRSFCSERSIFLIEDCAHGFLGYCSGRKFGEWGDYAITSLSKLFPAVEGGLMISAHGKIDLTQYRPSIKRELDVWSAAMARSKRWGRTPPSSMLALGGGIGASSVPNADDEPTENLLTRGVSRATRHAVLRTDLVEQAAQRRENFAYLLDSVRGFKHARPLFAQLPASVVPYAFPLELKIPSQHLAALRARGVPFIQWNHSHPERHAALCPTATRYAQSLIQLPVHQSLTDDETEKIAEVLYDILR